MITEKNNVFYCDCGFSFQKGRSGSHDCADGLRNKLAQSEVRYAALAAENAGLKQAITTHSQSTHFCEVCGKDDPCSTDDVCYVLNETPATDAAIANLRAQGVEMFAKHCQKRHGEMMKSEPNEAASNQAITATRRAGEFALYFADQLRKGVQS
ncbi:hypothetical protein UXO05_02810 [Enterobacter ludwigii]|uniref:hypothetical protein n=1 Tax=Enterobacter ludwigii TaxID=299767 RepID=UPI002FD3BF6D